MATQATGSYTKIIYDNETTFSYVRASVDAHVLPFVSESLRMTRNLVESASIRGNRNPRSPVQGNREVGGDITVELDPYMGKLLYNALGTFTTAGSSPYSHTFTVSELPPGLTIEKQFLNLDTPEYFVFQGCRVNSMRMSFKPEGFIETVFNFMGATNTESVSSLDSTPTDYTASAVGDAFTGFDATIKENSVALGTVTELELTVENNLDGSLYVIDGTGKRYNIPSGLVRASGTLRALFTDMTLYNRAVNNTETSLEITLKKGTGDGSANNEQIKITLDEVLLTPQAPVINGPQGILVEFPFQCYYQDNASASSIRIELLNTQTQAAIMN